MKFYRGSPGAARTYVEQDRSRADDYYLAEGSGVATRYVASPMTGVSSAGSLTGDAYEGWVGGYCAETGASKGGCDRMRRHCDPEQVGLPIVAGAPRVGAIDRELVVGVVLTRLGARRSAWNAADIRGEVEQWIAGTGLVADAAVRIDLAEDLTARVLGGCEPLLPRGDVPEHIRALTSLEVLAVEADIVTRLIGRAEQPARHVA